MISFTTNGHPFVRFNKSADVNNVHAGCELIKLRLNYQLWDGALLGPERLACMEDNGITMVPSP
jgi:hypothetical protein